MSTTQLLVRFPMPPESESVGTDRLRSDLFPNPPSGRTFRHVDGLNVPDVFDVLSDIGVAGEQQVASAPYGRETSVASDGY